MHTINNILCLHYFSLRLPVELECLSPKRLEIFQLQCVIKKINSGEVKVQACTHCLLHTVLCPPFCPSSIQTLTASIYKDKNIKKEAEMSKKSCIICFFCNYLLGHRNQIFILH